MKRENYAISTTKLTRLFGGTTAVDNLTLEVSEGELFGLVGPDGAGKSTVMRLLAAIMDPTSGDAWVNGLHTVRESDAIKDSIGYMSQKFGLYPDLTVIENIDFYADIYGVRDASRADRISRLLEFSNLGPFKKRLVGNLSGGMKQKLGLACALVHTPKIIFLDEPTNGVDPVSRRDFWKILHKLEEEGVTVFVSTCYLDEAERCDRLALMDKGRLLAVGTPDEVKGHMNGSVIDLMTSSSRKAAALLRDSLAGCSIGLFGDRVHIITGEPDRIIAELEKTLKEAGIEIISAKKERPTLEDVFISIGNK